MCICKTKTTEVYGATGRPAYYLLARKCMKALTPSPTPNMVDFGGKTAWLVQKTRTKCMTISPSPEMDGMLVVILNVSTLDS